MRRRLTFYRRRWCGWRGHPQADWSPIVMWWDDVTVRAYRCARHDRRVAQ